MCFIIFIRIFEMKKRVKAFEALSKVFRRSKKKILGDRVRDSVQKIFCDVSDVTIFLMPKNTGFTRAEQ